MDVAVRTIRIIPDPNIEDTVYMTFKECLTESKDKNYTNYENLEIGSKIAKRLIPNSKESICLLDLPDIGEDILLEKYKKNYDKIKKFVCDKIMNDEIHLNVFISDFDTYDLDEKDINYDKLYII